MNDYLGRLIARSIGATESVGDLIRPRVPSLFEPADIASQPPPVESSFERSRSTSASMQGSSYDEPERRSASIDRPAPSSIIPRHRDGSPSDKAADEPTLIHRGNLSHTAQSTVHESRQRNAVSVSAVYNADRPNEPKASIPTMLDNGQAFRRRPSLESVQPNTQAPSFLDVPQPDRAAPPVVRVTIGRIDVRAVMPAGDTRRPNKPSAPKLSLDDYLARRRTRRT